MNPYSDNSYNNYYTPQRSVYVNKDGINQKEYIKHPSEGPIKEIKHIFAIDSRQRDFSIYPEPNEYSISVPEYYKNIRSIELKAAIIPKSEYNINSNNNVIPFIVGDFIRSVKLSGSLFNKFKRTTSQIPIPDGTIITFSVSGGNPSLEATLSGTTLNGGIGQIAITHGGAGYTPDDPIRITASVVGYADITDGFVVEVGIKYEATLREGQYSNTGNPEYYHIGDGTVGTAGDRTIMRSNVPVCGLSREIENAIGASIYSRHGNNVGLTYKRLGWYELPYNGTPSTYNTTSGTNKSTTDYPAPVSVRYVSQYPVLDRFGSYNMANDSAYNYDTNACNFNRMNFSNNLIIKVSSDITNAQVGNIGDYIIIDDFVYQVNDYHYIGVNGMEHDYLLILYPVGIYTTPTVVPGWEIYSSSNVWSGIEDTSTYVAGTDINYPNFFDPTDAVVETVVINGTSPWHLMFKENTADIASLIGFNRVNYLSGTNLPPVIIESKTKKNYLHGAGYTHRTSNDWALYAGPEYVILSFRSKLNNTSNTLLSELNDRVDSDQVSNVGRSFACLIFDNTQPAVLQGLTTSRGPDFDLSGKQKTEATSRYTQILDMASDYTNIGGGGQQHGKILDSYIGNYNSSLYTYPGLTKAIKGQDFDIKKIEFLQPVSRLANISIQFTKFSKVNKQTADELYNFRGREHLLLFEITTCENTNVY